MRPPLARGISLYAALFGMLLILLLGVVVVEDRALRVAYESQAARDAVTAARHVEALVERPVAVIRELQIAAGGRDGIERLLERVEPLGAAQLGLDRLLLADADGHLVSYTSFGGPAASAADAAALLRLALETRAVPGDVLLRPVGDARGTIVFAGLASRDSGSPVTVVGSVDAATLLREVLTDPVARRRAIVIRQGTDTVAISGAYQDDAVRTASAQASLPGRTRWQVEVVHDDTNPGLRATFWALGGSALLFLVLGLARERRQAQHVAERSAELERLSTELLRSNRMKSEFLANISHELRTPLNAIVGFVELLKDGVYGELSPRQINPVDRIAGSATHLRHLVDQVLDIAKMAAGRLEVHLEPVVLRPFVLNIASELESLAADKGIVLSLTVSASLPRVRTDPSHLRQILVNLVGNAIKYTPSGGAVAIRTRLVTPPGVSWRAPTPPAGTPFPRPMTNPQGQRAIEDEAALAALAARSPDPAHAWVAVQVSDTGVGIAPDDHERIFEEFEQVDAGPRGESMQRGTGLGLPISRRLARLLGGDVTVDSSVGKGATFTVWLPVELTPAG